jgi:hypothetical protein
MDAPLCKASGWGKFRNWGVTMNDIKKPGNAKNEAGRWCLAVFSRIYKAPASCGKSARG